MIFHLHWFTLICISVCFIGTIGIRGCNRLTAVVINSTASSLSKII
jgi:hypothetical protein